MSGLFFFTCSNPALPDGVVIGIGDETVCGRYFAIEQDSHTWESHWNHTKCVKFVHLNANTVLRIENLLELWNAATLPTAKFIIWAQIKTEWETSDRQNWTCVMYAKCKWTLWSRPANDGRIEGWMLGTDVEETTSRDQINAYYLFESSASHEADIAPSEAAWQHIPKGHAIHHRDG